MAGNCPRLQLNLSTSATSFKRSFDELGLDLDSPADAQASGSSGQGGSHGGGSLEGNSERNKRARSGSNSSDAGDIGEPLVPASDPSISSSSSAMSGSITASLRSDVASGMPLRAVSPVIHAGGSSSNAMPDIFELPAAHTEDIDMTIPSPPDSHASSTSNILLPASPPPATQNEHYRISMERFSTFDSNISVLRNSPSPLPTPSLPPLSRSLLEVGSNNDVPPSPAVIHSLSRDDSFASTSHSSHSPHESPALHRASPILPSLNTESSVLPSFDAAWEGVRTWYDEPEEIDPWRSPRARSPQPDRGTLQERNPSSLQIADTRDSSVRPSNIQNITQMSRTHSAIYPWTHSLSGSTPSRQNIIENVDGSHNEWVIPRPRTYAPPVSDAFFRDSSLRPAESLDDNLTFERFRPSFGTTSDYDTVSTAVPSESQTSNIDTEPTNRVTRFPSREALLDEVDALREALSELERRHDDTSTLEPGSHSRARRPSYQNDRSFGTYPRTRQPSGPRRRPEFVHNDNSGVDPVVNGMAGIRRRIDALEAAAANLASQSAEGANVRNEPVSQTFTLRALSGSRRRIVHRDDGVVETDTPAAPFPTETADVSAIDHTSHRLFGDSSRDLFPLDSSENRLTGIADGRGRSTFTSRLYNTRPAPSNSLMSENAAERRRRTARDQALSGHLEESWTDRTRCENLGRSSRGGSDLSWRRGPLIEPPSPSDQYQDNAGQGSDSEDILNHRVQSARDRISRPLHLTTRLSSALHPPSYVLDRTRFNSDHGVDRSSNRDQMRSNLRTSRTVSDSHNAVELPNASDWQRQTLFNDFRHPRTNTSLPPAPEVLFSTMQRRRNGLELNSYATSSDLGTVHHLPRQRSSHRPDSDLSLSGEIAALLASGSSVSSHPWRLSSTSLEAVRRQRSSRLAALHDLATTSEESSVDQPPPRLDRLRRLTSTGTYFFDQDDAHSPDRDNFELDARAELRSSLDASGIFDSPPRPSSPVGITPIPPALSTPSSQESSATTRSGNSLGRHYNLDLDVFHDGPFRASLARTVEMNRRRLVRQLDSRFNDSSSQPPSLPPLSFQRESTLSSTELASRPRLPSISVLSGASGPPDIPSQLDSSANDDARPAIPVNIMDRPDERPQDSVTMLRQAILRRRSPWSESDPHSRADRSAYTTDTRTIPDHRAHQRSNDQHTDRNEAELHNFFMQRPRLEASRVADDNETPSSWRVQALRADANANSWRQRQLIQQRREQEEERHYSTGLWGELEDEDEISEPGMRGSMFRSPEALARWRRIRGERTNSFLPRPTNIPGYTAPFHFASRSGSPEPPEPPESLPPVEHRTRPYSRSPSRDNDRLSELRAASQRAARMRLLRRRQADAVGPDIPFTSGDAPRSGSFPRVASLRSRNFGDYVRDEDLDTSYEGLLQLSTLLGEARPRGTPQQVIVSLPRGFYKDWAKTGETEERCPICLDDYQPEDTVLKVPDCSHWFHGGCLEQWLKGAQTCPVCRGRVASQPARRVRLSDRAQQTLHSVAAPSGSGSTRRGGVTTQPDENDEEDTSGDETPRLRASPPWRLN
ncbi:hypothetical protein AcV5_003082 [Taiwanofungus camphoratus]|nr:hypothetical protein AcV5_003082 [Antrodia cinnamomea]